MLSDSFVFPQGAWRYVKSRLECTLRELLPGGDSIPALRYIGRPVAASPGTLHIVPCGSSLLLRPCYCFGSPSKLAEWHALCLQQQLRWRFIRPN